MQVKHMQVTQRNEVRGFSFLEIVIVLAVMLAVTVVALPSLKNTLLVDRLLGDARSIQSQLALVRMRSATDSTQARLNFSTTSNTYWVEVYNAATSSFSTEGGVYSLSQGNSFGYGSITTGAGSPAQTTIQQVVPITFNSRSLPTSGGAPITGTEAIYLTNGSGGYYAVTLTISGKTTIWRYDGTNWQQAK